MGVILPGNPQDREWQKNYIDLVNAYLCDPTKDELLRANQHDAICRFNPQTILEQWERKVLL